MIRVFYSQRVVEPNCIGTNWIHLREEGEEGAKEGGTNCKLLLLLSTGAAAVDWCPTQLAEGKGSASREVLIPSKLL